MCALMPKVCAAPRSLTLMTPGRDSLPMTCVWLWSNLPRKASMEPDEALLKRWQQYLAGYRAGGGHVTDADLAALPLFVQLRHLWNMGEGVARIHHWAPT